MVEALADGGFVAPREEADELIAAAGGDGAALAAMLARRLTGEPLAWITGTTTFCGHVVRVDPGVYVPRWQSEVVAAAALARLEERGVAVEVCCGAGAIAVVLGAERPGARVIGCDVDPAAVACARSNGVEALAGDLLAPVPAELRGHVDVVVGVVPYVPTGELGLLQRDTLAFESTLSYDGGADGLGLMRRVVREAVSVLRGGGALLLELGGGQADAIAVDLGAAGYRDVEVLRDEDGDVRGVQALRAG